MVVLPVRALCLQMREVRGTVNVTKDGGWALRVCARIAESSPRFSQTITEASKQLCGNEKRQQKMIES